MSSDVRVFLAIGRVDLRGAFDHLAAITRNLLKMDPASGALFVFANRTRNRLKCLWWDQNGYVILYKRLVRGSFPLPAISTTEQPVIQLTRSEFSAILAASGVVPARKLH